MSMHTYLVAFHPPDEKWRKMKSVYDACVGAGVKAPDEVYDFFNDEKPDESGVKIDLKGHESVSLWSRDMEVGFEIDISKLPKGVKTIRFINSY